MNAALEQVLEARRLSSLSVNREIFALSLEQKPALVASCEAGLRALHEALARRGYNYDRFR